MAMVNIKLAVFFILLIAITHLGRRDLYASDENVNSIDFIENKGQWDERVKFKAFLPGGMVLFTEMGFVYDFWKEEDVGRYHSKFYGQVGELGNSSDTENLFIRHHAYSVLLKGAQYTSKWNVEGKRSYYHNYFIGNDSNNWKNYVGLYNKVVQECVYPGIDMMVYSVGSSLKYDFYISVGSDPGLILLEFEGVHPQLMDDGSLSIQTTVNEVIEHAPYAYQFIDGDNVPVPCNYKLTGRVLSFTFPNGYDEAYPLIIDPELVFSTYSGGLGGRKIAYASAYDDDGNLYAGSLEPYYIFGSTGWPITIGAYQTLPGGGDCEMAISKFNSTGTELMYATYYGGDGAEYPSAMVVNENNELIVVGPTNSSNLPVTSGCFDNTYNGNHDLFVVRFNNTGSSLLGATYIGSSGEEVGLDPIYNPLFLNGYPPDYYEEINSISNIEVALDKNGAIWATSVSNGDTFPVTANALQNAKSGGYDGVVFQMNADCSQLLYSTYIGGSGNDVLTNLVLNNAGNVVLCGGTQSVDFPVTTGALFSTPLGKTDGFVSVIDAQIGSLLHSTYLGTNQIDLANLLQVDADDNVYVLGGTQGNYPISPGVYHIPNTDLFIDKLSADLSQSLLSTRLGNRLNQGDRVKPISFLYDKACGNIYVSTIKASPTLPVTPDAYESSPRQFWFCALKTNFSSLDYATFFGSNLHSDHTHSGIHRFDKKGNLYMNICSQAENFPITPNAAFPRKLNVWWDNLIFKFAIKDPLFPISRIELPPGLNDTICGVPGTFSFNNISTGSNRYLWDFGDGTIDSNSFNGVHTYVQSGTFTVRLIAYNDSSCLTMDTCSYSVTLIELPKPDISIQDTTIFCDLMNPIDLRVIVNNPSNNNYFEWGPDLGIVGDNNREIVSVIPFLNHKYYVIVSDSIPGICSLSTIDTIHIEMPYYDLFSNKLNISPACKGVANGYASFTAESVDTSDYRLEWRSVNDTTLLSIENILTDVVSGYYNLNVRILKNCDTNFTIYFYIPSEEYIVSFTPSDTLVCVGDTIQFLNTSELYFRLWDWSFGDSNSSIFRDPFHQYAESGKFEVRLVGEGVKCSDTVFQVIHVDAPGAIPAFKLEKDSFCIGYPVLITPSNDQSATALHWDFGDDSWVNSPEECLQYRYDRPGLRYITLTTEFRVCPATSFTKVISVYPNPLVKLAADSMLCLRGGPIILMNLADNGLGDYRNQWNINEDTSKLLKVIHPGKYTLTVTNKHGCTTSEEIIIGKDCYIDIPNSFTPNGDGTNDYFFPRQLLSQSVEAFRMQVFNRWGSVVFETSSTNGRGWDGTFNGADQPVGVYVYLVEIVFDDGFMERYDGNVTLLR